MTETDPRWSEVAGSVAMGTRLAPGDRVMIALTDLEAYPAAEALVAACYAAGAYPQVQLVDERFDRALLRFGSDQQVAWVPEIEAHGMEWADVYVAVRGLVPPDPRARDHEPFRVAALRAAKGRVSTLRWQRTRWCLVRVPGPSWAAYVDVPLADLLDEFFASCTLDWQRLRQRWEELADRLSGARDVRIVAPGTELEFSVAGRSWLVFAGERNLPDGEIATAPLESSVTGTLAFEDPFVFAGQRVAGLSLTWEGGELTSVEADEGAALARALVRTDEGASRLGEFGIGLNPELTRLTQDLFFDEKVLGTVHVALGRAYPECGGTNYSALHWDVVKDLRARGGRPGGDVLVDGEPLLAQGVPRW